jgi:hypothetical protein
VPAFSSLTRATRTRRIEIRLPGVEQPVPVDVRAVSALEEQQAASFALGEARSKGAKPEPGDAIYDTALWARIVSFAYLDIDGQNGAPFFDAGPAQVLTLPVDSIVTLFSEQQRWQEEVSPSFKARSAADLVQIVKNIAADSGEVFFSHLSPSMQTASARFMAALLLSSPDSSWQHGLPATDSTTSSSPEPPKP